MKERPILFSGAMVSAILDGRKTQTRRVVKPQPIPDRQMDGGFYIPQPKRTMTPRQVSGQIAVKAPYIHVCCPYGQPGDRLWVRETWGQYRVAPPGIVYRADGDLPCGAPERWRPSIHMPRSACRLVLEVTGVRVERLNDCSEADAVAEGVLPYAIYGGDVASWKGSSEMPAARDTAVEAYRDLWNSINGAGSWDVNPWVWVIEFRRAAAALGESK